MENKKPVYGVVFDYESVKDRILSLSPFCTLYFYVKFGAKTKDNEKIPVHQEYKFKSRYINTNGTIYVRRNFVPYLCIEYKNDELMYGKFDIKISYYDMGFFKDRIKEAEKLAYNAFGYNDKRNEYSIIDNFKIDMIINGFKLEFSPIIYNDESSYDQHPGIGLYINDSDSIIMNLSTWRAFTYIVDSCDLFGWGSSVVAGYAGHLSGADDGYQYNNVNTPSYDEANDESIQSKKKNFFENN